eukprot:4295447-Amphidinium_carterae.1
MVNLRALELYVNTLTGALPARGLTPMLRISTLVISRNHFTGTLPLAGLPPTRHLVAFGIFANKFSGALHSVPSMWRHLLYFVVSDNYFQGQLPTGILSANRLNWYYASQNLFAGTIPEELGIARHLHSFAVTSMQHRGRVPVAMSRLALVERVLLGHGLRGRLPQLRATLNVLSVWTNDLTGHLPEYYMDMGKCLLLAHRNHFSCRIPSFAQVEAKLSLALIGNHFRLPTSFPAW